MGIRMKKPAKLLLAAIVIGGALFGVRKGMEAGLIPQPGFMASLVPVKAELPDVREAKVENVKPLPLPLKGAADVSSTLIRGSIWEWNSQMGMILANGGPVTSKGSIMERRGVNLRLTRQDDTVKMGEELVACAKELSEGSKQCSSGANFVVIMGDGVAQFAAGLNPLLEEIGERYKLAAIGSTGYSRGEDQFMAPAEVKADPQAAKGLLVAGVVRDGDWNIVLKWAGDNGIKNNPDEKTYDPDAINWYNSKDYNQAAADYVSNLCEERQVVKNGKPTSEKKKVCVNAVTTWTPGDVTAAMGRGGLVRIVSSKEYRSQMPSIIIGPRAFFEDNREQVENFLAAIFEGGDQIKAYDQSLRKASELAYVTYNNDQSPEYWYKYFKGVVEKDKQGKMVELGGSAVNNLADNLILFGIAPGTNDNFRSTYTTFANIVIQQYPEMFEETKIPDVKDVEDKSFVIGAQEIMEDTGAEADKPVYMAGGSVVSNKDYHITFASGKADLTSEGVRQLNEIKDNIAITGLFIRLTGHTDSQGDEALVNRPLSVARAQAVKSFLQAKAPANFPEERFEVRGIGSASPVDTNSTESGRAANRRVQITLSGDSVAGN